jgi:hypothetical protein
VISAAATLGTAALLGGNAFDPNALTPFGLLLDELNGVGVATVTPPQDRAASGPDLPC